ncbi:uncharacterized protein ACWYII_034237 isoform 1-T3 [Salvelinus alpinus]|uniref:uncharacterized protein n=1 Tax=Salvelinus alpinus TaxID=8036 RepID=UPI0039FCCDD0
MPELLPTGTGPSLQPAATVSWKDKEKDKEKVLGRRSGGVPHRERRRGAAERAGILPRSEMPAICDLCFHPPLKREQPGRTLTGGNTPKLTHTQAQPQAQVQAGKRLHVYLEETRVSQSGTYTHTKQEVLLTNNTRVKKSISRAKSSKSADLSAKNTSTEERTEQRKVRTCLKAAIGVKCHSNYSALLGVSLKLHTKTLRAIADTASDTVTVTDRDTDTMGRKNSARRRSRKSSFEDGGGASSQENTPTKTQPAPEISSTSSDNNTPTAGDSTPWRLHPLLL